MVLTPTAQAYFLPAFMRMCEMESDHARELPPTLISVLKQSKELRSKLSETQRRSVLAFFEEWFPRVTDDELRRQLMTGGR